MEPRFRAKLVKRTILQVIVTRPITYTGLVVRKGRDFDIDDGYASIGRRCAVEEFVAGTMAARRKVLRIAERQSINRRRRYSPDSEAESYTGYRAVQRMRLSSLSIPRPSVSLSSHNSECTDDASTPPCHTFASVPLPVRVGRKTEASEEVTSIRVEWFAAMGNGRGRKVDRAG